MRRILFVDDEPRVLDGLRRMLRSQRPEWDMAFAVGGEAAITYVEAHAVDVIVTDMRMPQVDGLAVLKHVREHLPHVVRIVLSGQTDVAAVSRSVPLAHQFLAKPCDPAQLKAVIERVCDLMALINDPKLRRLVGELGELPVLPQVYTQLSTALDDPRSSMRDIVRIVERDIALAARCLQVVNSAFFGLPRRVQTLDQAVSYLGLSVLRDLVLSSEVFSSFRGRAGLSQAELEQFERHALLTANIARTLLPEKELAHQAFLAGILHDLGRLILATQAPTGRLADDVDGWGRPVVGPADGQRGVTHAEVGAYLLGLWGLPQAIVEAVAYHHRADQVKSDQFDVVGAVYLGNLLAHEVATGDRSGLDASPAMDYLAAREVVDELPAWRAMAAAVAASGVN